MPGTSARAAGRPAWWGSRRTPPSTTRPRAPPRRPPGRWRPTARSRAVGITRPSVGKPCAREHLVVVRALLADVGVRGVRILEDVVALLGRAPDRVRRGRGQPHRRVGRLQRLGQDLDAVVAPELALVATALVPPGGQHDLDALAEAVGALLHRHAEGLELDAVEAAAGAPVHAAAREDVDHGDLLGEPQRVVERGQRHGHARSGRSASCDATWVAMTLIDGQTL